MGKKHIERACDHNKGIACNREECIIRCGWNPYEAGCRKRLIDDGNGLQVGDDGLKRLVIKKEEINEDADRDL